ncbi:MAG: effector binding domain-containing protein [Gracilimonas sp.]|nr:effector binding domain-containing protein [Gracilimonas sp.]
MKVVQKEAFWVIGFQVQATYDQLWNKMPEAWQDFYQSAQDIPNRKNDIYMDISFGKNQYGIYTQFIGAEITDQEAKVPKNMQKIQISAKKYLHHTHEGALKHIANSFQELYERAKEKNLQTRDFKLDIGYKPNESERPHELFIEIL